MNERTAVWITAGIIALLEFKLFSNWQALIIVWPFSLMLLTLLARYRYLGRAEIVLMAIVVGYLADVLVGAEPLSLLIGYFLAGVLLALTQQWGRMSINDNVLIFLLSLLVIEVVLVTFSLEIDRATWLAYLTKQLIFSGLVFTGIDGAYRRVIRT